MDLKLWGRMASRGVRAGGPVLTTFFYKVINLFIKGKSGSSGF